MDWYNVNFFSTKKISNRVATKECLIPCNTFYFEYTIIGHNQPHRGNINAHQQQQAEGGGELSTKIYRDIYSEDIYNVSSCIFIH